MFRLFTWIVKLVIFICVVLVLGSTLKWHGKTISDQVKTQVSHAEGLPLASQIMSEWDKLLQDSKIGAARMQKTSEGKPQEVIPPSERQKLKALIRELNSSRGTN